MLVNFTFFERRGLPALAVRLGADVPAGGEVARRPPRCDRDRLARRPTLKGRKAERRRSGQQTHRNHRFSTGLIAINMDV